RGSGERPASAVCPGADRLLQAAAPGGDAWPLRKQKTGQLTGSISAPCFRTSLVNWPVRPLLHCPCGRFPDNTHKTCLHISFHLSHLHSLLKYLLLCILLSDCLVHLSVQWPYDRIIVPV